MRIGFIGAGNMATAILEGILGSGRAPGALAASDVDAGRVEALRAAHPEIEAFLDNLALVDWAQMVVLCVKPQYCHNVLSQIAPRMAGKALLSIVAGLSTQQLQLSLPGARVLKTMPNTPLLVGAGMTALSRETTFTDAERAAAEGIFRAAGEIEWVEEAWMHGVTALSGSGPAYGYVMIEAMADAAVKLGLPRALSYRLAAQTLKGAGEMVLRTGRHPGALKDDVCSPGGTTIEAILELEASGFRAALQSAMVANAEKSMKLNT